MMLHQVNDLDLELRQTETLTLGQGSPQDSAGGEGGRGEKGGGAREGILFQQNDNIKRNLKLEDNKDDMDDFNERSDNLVYYKNELPLIWIGGVPRSGTTLMRAMLDAHDDVRCGEETRIIPRILGMHTGITNSITEMSRLKEAKIDSDVLDSALGAYILSIIAQHGEPAPRLCNKDPFTLKSMSRLSKIFPHSKFIMMIRDGRATVHSIISRHVTIKGFDIKTYRGALQNWNRAISNMYEECMKHGETVCLPVYYEQLVLHPETQMRRILQFLNIPWDEKVLHHELAIGKEKGVSLSK